MAAWQYYARRLYNKENKIRHHVLKKILSLYLAGFTGVAIYHQCSSVSEKKAKLELSTTSFDFGSIKKDSIYEGNVIITNSGNASLVIEKISPGCGCTTVNLSKEIVLPDDTCMLTFLYNTHNRIGKQDNFITILANTDSLIHILQINAYVY